MTKKHYQRTAEILRKVLLASTKPEMRAIWRIAAEFSAWFEADNPRFDAERFHAAIHGDS